MATTKKPAFRVLIARDEKDAQLIRVGALWPSKNDTLTGEVDLISAKYRLVVVPYKEGDEAAD